jgi:exosortase
MSHGYFVPLVAIGLLWLRKDRRPRGADAPGTMWFAIGLAVLLTGAGLRAAGILFRSTTIESWSLLPFIVGLVIASLGKKGILWSWPAIVFLAFMLPIPGAIGGLLSSALQRIATIASTYFLQVLAVPAVAQGNVIWLTDQQIGVAEACNGLRMLTSFCAMAVAACFVLDRPRWQKAAILLSAPAIGIAANIFRITLTGLAYEWGNPRVAGAIYHDVAGWLMMPIGLFLLGLELLILSRILLPEDQTEPTHQSVRGALPLP